MRRYTFRFIYHLNLYLEKDFISLLFYFLVIGLYSLGTTLDCDDGEFKCDEDLCLPMSARCNTRRDCSDGSDELDCPNSQYSATLLFSPTASQNVYNDDLA